MKCPKCLKPQEAFAICDDDCGTLICLDCNTAFYYSYDFYDNKIIILGHDANCGQHKKLKYRYH